MSSEWGAERAVLDGEAERLRVARLSLRERLLALVPAEVSVSVDLIDGGTERAALTAVGADWIALASTPIGALVLPLHAVAAIAVAREDQLRSTLPVRLASAALSERIGLGFVLRDVARRRLPVVLTIRGGRSIAGTIERAGADHLDLAVHDPGSSPRPTTVTGHRIIPFAALVRVRVDAPLVLR